MRAREFKDCIIAKSELESDISDSVNVMKKLQVMSYAARTFNCHKKYEQSLKYHIA